MDKLKTNKKTFTIDYTNYAKGIGIILLLVHHLFYNDPKNYGLFKSLFVHNSVPIECYIATFCKVCVAIFVFLSGYGLFFSYSKYLRKLEKGEIKNRGWIVNSAIFVGKKLIKLLSQYWIVFIIFVPMGLLFGRSFIDVYGSNRFIIWLTFLDYHICFIILIIL